MSDEVNRAMKIINELLEAGCESNTPTIELLKIAVKIRNNELLKEVTHALWKKI